MDFLKINPADNVAVALHPLPKGMAALGVTLLQDVPQGHKFTLTDLSAGDNVIKYGYPIGHVTKDAPAGTWIDHSCIKTNLSGLLEYKYEPVPEVSALTGTKAAEAVSPCPKTPENGHGKAENGAVVPENPQKRARGTATFKGFRRADGQVGIRNQIWVIPTVGCVNGICEEIVGRFKEEICHSERSEESSVDAIVTFPHNYGCSQLGGDHENTRKVLSDMVHHPNAGGVLVVSLGCENNQLDAFRELVGPVDESRVKMFACQKVEDEIEYGLHCLREIYAACKDDVREDVPVGELRVGLKCGGSDGLSGITANPLLGVFSDWLVEQGGTTVLTEVPEMFGAETILMNRCQDEATFGQTVHLINDFKDYFMKQGMPVYENPSPGKDLVASTALGASGCQMVLFTTGRGTPFGSFVPTMDELAVKFRDYVLAVASGEPVNNEKHGRREIAIFKTGVTL